MSHSQSSCRGRKKSREYEFLEDIQFFTPIRRAVSGFLEDIQFFTPISTHFPQMHTSYETPNLTNLALLVGSPSRDSTENWNRIGIR